MKLSDFVIQRIYKAGVKHVFMLPGGGAMHLNDSLGKSKFGSSLLYNLNFKVKRLLGQPDSWNLIIFCHLIILTPAMAPTGIIQTCWNRPLLQSALAMRRCPSPNTI